MDGTRFDAVSRALASGTSRRRLLKGIVAGAIGAFSAKALPAAAETCTAPGPRAFCNSDAECCDQSVCRLGVCTCPSGTKACGERCIPTANTCGPVYCPAGFKVCGGICKDVSRDVNNCGSCGHACGIGKTCSNGQCCAKGKVYCNGTCKLASQCELLT